MMELSTDNLDEAKNTIEDFKLWVGLGGSLFSDCS